MDFDAWGQKNCVGEFWRSDATVTEWYCTDVEDAVLFKCVFGGTIETRYCTPVRGTCARSRWRIATWLQKHHGMTTQDRGCYFLRSEAIRDLFLETFDSE